MLGFAFTVFSVSMAIGAMLMTPAIIGFFLSVPYICAIGWDKNLTDTQKDKALMSNSIAGILFIFFKAFPFYISLLNFKKPKTLFFTMLYNSFAIFVLYKIYQFIIWFIS